MKKNLFALSVLVAIGLYACQKNSDDATLITLTPSTTQAKVGETVSVTLAANANASNWTVSPASSVAKTYSLTTSKVNYFTFSQAGTYTVSVRTKNVTCDTTSAQAMVAAWNRTGGKCTKGVDTASVSITVAGK